MAATESLTAAQAQQAIETTAAEGLTATPALEITEKLTAAQGLQALVSRTKLLF